MRSGRLGRAPLLLLVLGCALGGFSLTFTHLAGSFGGPGFEDGSGSVARFKSAGLMAVDSSGNVYVADTGNHTIRVVSPSGEVKTLAGLAETSGSTEGRGAKALFNSPNGVYVNASGTVYVADTGNHTIRKISSGYASTLAGSPGLFGLVNDTGTAARFRSPQGITGDLSGNLYVADTSNHAIRMITSAGVVTTLAGTGTAGNVNATGTAASFSNPKGIVYDPISGSLFVADSGNRVIRQITLPGAVVTTFAGTMSTSGHVDGVPGVGRMWGPSGIAVDASGAFYVSDSTDSTIRSITSSGTLGTLAGITFYPGPDDGFGSLARFSSPVGIAVHSTTAYVSDTGNHTLRKIALSGPTVTTLAGLAHESGTTNATGSAARFDGPTGLAFYPGPGGFAYVSDTNNSRIRRVGLDGVVTALAGSSYGYQDGTGTNAKFRSPRGLAMNYSTASVFVADTDNHCIRLVTASGDVSTYAGQGFSSGMVNGDRLTTAKFSSPRGVALNYTATALYVADTGNRRVRKINTGTGEVTTLAGSGSYGVADGNGAAATFGQITGIMVDTSENVYVTESLNGLIRKIEPDGDVTTLAGSGSCCTPIDGTGAAARFGYPGPTSIGGYSGTGHIADPNGQLIRSINLSSGAVGTAGGKASVNGTSDGTGTFARFNNPTDIAELGGEVVIAEKNKIRYGITEIADRATIDSSAGLVGNARQLDMSPQTATSWEWSIIRRPAGSTATLSSTSIRNPTFTPDVADRYVFRCKATSSSGMSISTVTLNGNDPAATLAVGYPGPFTAGQLFVFDVSALDPWGNTADGYTGTVTVTSSDPQATLPSDYTFTPSDHGSHMLSITLRTAGPQTITVTDTVNGTITGTGNFTVNATAASVLNVSMNASVASGTATNATVTARDPYGNVATSYLGTIQFTSSDGLATLPSNYTFISGNQGVKTFFSGVTLRTGGVQSVTATDTVTASITGSTNVTVFPAAPVTFTATRSASQIQLAWSASPGADHYDIYRASAGTYVFLTSVAGIAHLDTTVSANTTYAYKVRAVNAGGDPSPYSPADAATTLVFTDDPMVANTTRVKTLHITEARTAVNSLRASAGLSAAAFTDPALSATTKIKKVHIDELRTALSAARTLLGLTAISFTDPTLVLNSTRVKGAHLTEIRSGVK